MSSPVSPSPPATGKGNVTTFSRFLVAVIGSSILKLLLLNTYRSTDFEVHRNWLAITHSLPLEKWYYENTSEWTLDYPPFFAYFEWALSQVAQYFDKDMLQLSNLNYASPQTILFQKLSVIVVDLLLAYSVLRCSRSSTVLLSSSSATTSPKRSKSSSSNSDGIPIETLFILIFLNGGLFFVDHIHFQYNGFLFGILLLSISKCLEGKYYESAFIFASLLNFKHIYLYMAPAFGIYFLRQQCFPPNLPLKVSSVAKSLLSFALIGVTVLGLSFGPFYAHTPQILQRLFPFQRGLSHAYWAPNMWAGYNTLDWLLNLALNKNRTSTVTSGLVGTTSMSFLPQVAPLHTFLLTLAFMLPALYLLWRSPSPANFIRSVVLTAWTSFMFGYHVHEKAILNVIIPFSLLSLQEPNLFFLTLTTGTMSLFPLLFTPTEIVLKAIITILHLSLTVQVLPLQKFSILQRLYLFGFIFVYIFENLGPTSLFLPNYPFLPLMLVSDYCFVGLFICYVDFYSKFLNLPLTRSTRGSSKTSQKTFTSANSSTYIFTTSTTTSSFSSSTINGSITNESASVTMSSSNTVRPMRSSIRTSPEVIKKIEEPTTTSPLSPSRSQTTSKKTAPVPTSDRVLRKRNK